ncbi:MAG TPA: DUF1501 domain-containing protein [Armatimonadota bacterium]|nr:DUF1501 domain-containing protein [Armatimonadota bacterium]
MADATSPLRHVHRTGIFRRELLQVGCLGAFGLSMTEAFAPRAACAASGGPRAKSVLLVWMPGGPPQMQLWDPKPDSPAECRGSAKPIPTSAPGVSLGHWLPRTARQAHHLALLRTVTLNAEDDNHNLGHHKLLSAVDVKPTGSGDYVSRFDWPSMGSVAGTFKKSAVGLPAAIQLPESILDGGQRVPGQTAGWMGSRYDPWQVEGDPNEAEFRVPDLMPLPEFGVERLGNRRKLLHAVERHRRDLDRDLSVRQLHDVQARAFTVATSAATRKAFDLDAEPAALRDRYGRHTFGQSLLLARRLVEAGVPFVQANMGGLNTWDFHGTEDASMEKLVPPFDQGFSTLIADLHERGLLNETLVICMGEMGRNPILGRSVAGAAANAATRDGRNHWQWCWTAVFAGGGVRGGTVVGQSDEWAGHPASEAYRPSDIGATVYTALGINPHSEVRDIQDRPMVVNEGEVIRKLF